MKLYVVPELSERCTGVIFVLERVHFGLIFVIAASFQAVISPR